MRFYWERTSGRTVNILDRRESPDRKIIATTYDTSLADLIVDGLNKLHEAGQTIYFRGDVSRAGRVFADA